MKQLLQSYRSGELWLADVPTTACGANGVLVRTHKSLVSAGTERMIVELAKKTLIGKARARPDLVRKVLKRIKSDGLGPTLEKVFAKLDEPITLGYSAAGQVVESGRNATSFQPGDRVAVAGAGYATHAEFNYVPSNLCVPIPGEVTDTEASFVTVGAIALQGVRQTAPMLGERIVVVGLGLLGLLTVQILKANGCAVLGVDVDPRRAELARTLGADQAVCEDAIAACDAFTHGRGADAVIITAATPSNEPIESAATMSRLKGRVVVVGMVGMNVPRDAFYTKELDLRLSMSYGPGRYDSSYEEGGCDYPFSYVRFTEQRNMESFLYLVAQKRVTPAALVTHEIAFDDALSAYQLLSGALPQDSPIERNYLGIVLDYPVDTPLDRVVATPAQKERRTHSMGGTTLGVAFVGAGGFARGVLLPEIAKHKDVQLTTVCTSRGSSARQTATSCGFLAATTESGSVFSDSNTAAVFVATSHESHASFACAALRAGQSVFVEKPLCLTDVELADYESALEHARQAGHAPCLMVGFNRRFSPHTNFLREQFAGRTTPMVINYRVNAGRIPLDHWIQDPRRGGGRILGECCHFIDFCSSLIDARPIRVSATSISCEREDVVAHDSVAIVVSYADGSLANVTYLAEGSSNMPKERCEVFAGGESATMDNFRVSQCFASEKSIRTRQAKGFAEELTAFFDTVRDGGNWPIPWESLVDTQRVCFATLRSLETGTPVPLGTP